MLIHRDPLIELIFDPKSNILSVKWLNLIDVPYSQIQLSLTELIDSINHYFVTKLLIDTMSTVSIIPENKYRPLALYLAGGLAATQLKKVARVVSANNVTEAKSKECAQEVHSRITFNFKSQEFDDKESAWVWLAKDED